MTYFKCVTCKARLYSAAGPNSLICDLCPDCGAMLEPVGELTELVGYRSIKLRDDPAERWLDDGGSFNGPAAASAAVHATARAQEDAEP